MKSLARRLLAWAFSGSDGGAVILMTHAQYARWIIWEKQYCELRVGDARFIGPILPPKVDSLGKQTKAAVRLRSGGKCELRYDNNCTKEAQDIHHILFKSKGGTNELENLYHTCISCHHAIHEIGLSPKSQSLSEKIAASIRWGK